MDTKKKEKLLAPLTYMENEKKRKVIVILEHCPLETAKVRDQFRLLSVDEHRQFLLQYNKTPEDYRPDIVHQCLLALLDSPLNKAGCLEVYIHTRQNVLIRVNPQIRLPRTYKRFAGLMVQLLHRYKIKAAEENAVLMKIIKNPITDHLPTGCKKICMSHHAKELVKLHEYVPKMFAEKKPMQNDSVVFVVGGYAHGAMNVDYCDEFMSISNFSLSAAAVCSKITNAFEEFWNVV